MSCGGLLDVYIQTSLMRLVVLLPRVRFRKSHFGFRDANVRYKLLNCIVATRRFSYFIRQSQNAIILSYQLSSLMQLC